MRPEKMVTNETYIKDSSNAQHAVWILSGLEVR